MKDIYILIVKLGKDRKIKIGNSMKDFKKGFYCYTGSGGISRILRHHRADKKLHWHIDYLLKYATIVAFRRLKGNECRFAASVTGIPVKNFGCSDCRCGSHLHFLGNAARKPHAEKRKRK